MDVVSHTLSHTPTVSFRHVPPNSARIGYATERALFLSARLATDAVSALRKVWVNNKDCGSSTASKHARKHEARPPRGKKKEFRLESNDFGFKCAGVSKVAVIKETPDII